MPYEVSLVPPSGLPDIWAEVKPLLERVLPTTAGRYQLVDVVHAIQNFQHQLWIALDEERKVKGIVTTTIITYPRKKAMVGLLCAGTELKHWMAPMLALLDHFAED